MLESIKPYLPIGYLNYYRFFKNMLAADRFGNSSLPDIFDRIVRTNYWQGVDGVCGITSGVAGTATLRPELQQLWQELGIRSILDIPCGDFIWMKEMDLSGIDYLGADIVQEMIEKNKSLYSAPNIRFECLDLTSATLPKVDIIICRDCLVHLTLENIQKAIANIKNSGSTWLLCTSFVQNKFNYNIKNGHWRTLNMEKAPFRFPQPVKTMIDNYYLEHSVFRDKALCLWRVADL
jgi:hypothetical protein